MLSKSRSWHNYVNNVHLTFIVDTHRKQTLDGGKFYEQTGSRVIECP